MQAGQDGALDEAKSVVMKFESLGGTGHGCEFGLFQRKYGGEPLGLLRWADLGHELLTTALVNRFDGVGAPEFTEVFVPENSEEWWTSDKRYWMAMRSFVRTDQVTYEQMRAQVTKRQGFLRRKLIADLEEGAKTFAYKNMIRNLSSGELRLLYEAVRGYGRNVLLYVRFADAAHPHGTVVPAAPGLLVGHIAHFGFSPEDKYIAPSEPLFLEVCRNAAAMREAGLAREDEDTPLGDDDLFDLDR